MKLIKYYKVDSILTVLSGLRIGGSAEKIEIGGIDNTIIKDPIRGYPYLPGSSLKGKLRSLLEYDTGRVSRNGNPWGLRDAGQMNQAGGVNSDPVLRIFGNSGADESKMGPTRFIARDIQLTDEFFTKLPSDLIEIKTENVINRLSGTAEKPRSAERILAGVEFNVTILFRIFDFADNGGVTDEELFWKYIPRALELLEMDCLGGYGSRGYGQVAFRSIQIYDSSTRKIVFPENTEEAANVNDLLNFNRVQELAS